LVLYNACFFNNLNGKFLPNVSAKAVPESATVISPLLTDLYQLTMAYGYWKLGMHEREAVFQVFFRKNPFGGNYAVACGLHAVIEFLNDWRFSPDDIAYLGTLKARNGEILFPTDFLDYLSKLEFACSVDAVLEGTVVFAQEPLLRIKGPILQCQLAESALLNMINFQTLIATKAARVCVAAGREAVLEFGLRRAQGMDGAVSASRAAYIGGCEATSNVLAGKRYGIPVRGTHAHSWVTAFPDEMAAFDAYASVMPHNCVLLVDTYDTLTGVRHAIEIGKKLRAQGNTLLGIRLDSGDLAALSIKARELLDTAGFTETQIVASNNLDENVIRDLRAHKAPITIWGVGTHLVTAYDQPALDGVYKLAALRADDGSWQYKIKLSEQIEKNTNPGIFQVRRYTHNGKQIMDVLYDIEAGISATPETLLLNEAGNTVAITTEHKGEDLLQPIFRGGKLIYLAEGIQIMRERSIAGVTQFLKHYAEQVYPVALEKSLHELKQKLIEENSAWNPVS
jgi:nicotinate phosphoribosyltransferase